MTISVIIPSYNRAHTLKGVLPRYLDESVGEILVVDDGSSDNTGSVLAKLAKGDSRIRHIRLPENRGQSAARNAGISASTGSHVFFGEDDAYPAAGALPTLLSCAEATGAAIVGPRLIYMQTGQTELDAAAHSSRRSPVDFDRMAFNFNSTASVQVPALHALMLIRREVFDGVQFDINFRGSAWGEETDFGLAAGSAGFELWFCGNAVVFHLPRERTGGAWARGRWSYEISAVRNQSYLLKKHRAFLLRNNYLHRSSSRVLVVFVLRRLAFNGRLFVRVLLGERRFATLVRLVRRIGRS